MLQITSNGFITFDTSFFDGVNRPFSETNFFQDVVIAPLWINADPIGTARRYFRVSRNQSDLYTLSRLITNATSDDNYHPMLAVIVTWHVANRFDDSLTVSDQYT